ncbi:glycosyltransferase family 17 protein [Acidimangrovimonas sediminis]|uniref:hypothetical protein n=1 Tax=Acidimangrovimonas sediminis TaxID=2056283 RepID=UPI000C80E955|nr:hypothetical protein [Acidimangrovimonas sediminis]
MRIYNCFPFFNELDLLEMRLVELDGLVDRYVIVEAARTFSGQPKPLFLKENMDRFARFADRIQRVEIDRFPEELTDWQREYYQFDQTLAAITDANPDDLILATDADEIPSAEAMRAVRAAPPRVGEVVQLELRWFNYYLNLERDETYLRGAPRAARRADVPSIRALRMVRGPADGWLRDKVRLWKAARAMGRPIRRRLIRNAGWHFSWLANGDSLSVKSEALPHHNSGEAGTPGIGSADAEQGAVETAREGREGFARREIGPDFPRLLRENPERFAHLLLA